MIYGFCPHARDVEAPPATLDERPSGRLFCRQATRVDANGEQRWLYCALKVELGRVESWAWIGVEAYTPLSRACDLVELARATGGRLELADFVPGAADAYMDLVLGKLDHLPWHGEWQPWQIGQLLEFQRIVPFPKLPDGNAVTA